MARREDTVFAPAARTASVSSDVFNVPDDTEYLLATIDITVVPGVDTVQVIVQHRDQVSGKFTDYATFTAGAATGTFIKVLGPDAVAAPGGANVEGKIGPCPAEFRIRVVHSAATTFNYSVGIQYS